MHRSMGFTLLATATVLVLAFQNCQSGSSDTKFSQASKSSPLSQGADGHGHPYDGKIFVLLGAPCEDGSKIRGRIVLKSSISADLVREECQEIPAVALSSSDFQIHTDDPQKLTYKSQVFINQLVGIKLDMSKVAPEFGPIAFYIGDETYFAGIPTDSDTAINTSTMKLYEDGKPLGPAHSFHADIREVGLGRFSHWKGELRFTASDNSNPLTNGRVYTYTVD